MSEAAPEERDARGLVRLTVCSDNQEASAIRALLDANGIYSFVQGEQHRSMLGILGPHIELHVLVAREDLEDAQALLEEAAPSAEGVSAAEAALEGGLSPEGEEAAHPKMDPAEDSDYRTERERARRLKTWVILGLFVIGPSLFYVILSLSRR